MAQQKQWNMSRAARGQSEKWIRQQYNAAIKAANERIKVISQPKYEAKAQAYEFYVKGDLQGAPYIKERGGRTVFKALPKGSTREESLEALRMVERFLGARTSTVSGITATERERRDILNDMLSQDHANRGGSGKAPRLTKNEADNILRWMGSPEGKAAKADYDSNQVREAVTKSVIAARGRQITPSVSDLYNQWFNSQQTLADWISQSENVIGYSKL